ncbi:thioredoxin-like protein [Terfezia boudieri ATCC MYA-4762]|uniref:Thioredoxin-like protein n=1 Tax=Terfezia boudieri ATCC MYA-4762 TaxID=1051890 RepID=A0A3N4LKI1_9PEZI|nr:thioredoxin-like protein [Terfezia boudieri ATCC MYA-4762]
MAPPDQAHLQTSESKLDPKVATLIDKHADKAIASSSKENVKDLSDDEDDLLAELERDDSAMDAFREKRMQQLHDEFARARRMKDQDHGYYGEAATEKEVLDATTSSKYCIAHFFHADFRRCKIMDNHLENLAQKHFDTKIIRIDVDKAPFLVERLKVKVLPCVISFIDGKGVDRLEGFEKLRNTDNFTTAMLESHFLLIGVFQRAKTTGDSAKKSIFGTEKKEDVFDDDDD